MAAVTNKRKLGSEYESLACERLENEGMQIIARNYRVRIGEIDIIARDGNELVFVEVKYRRGTEYGGAWYAVPAKKQSVIRRVAEWYMVQNHIPLNAYCRFDVVLIDADDLTHLRNAF